MAAGIWQERCQVSHVVRGNWNPDLGVKPHILNGGNSVFKMLSHQIGETKHKDRRDGVPRPPLCDSHIKPEMSDKDDQGDI